MAECSGLPADMSALRINQAEAERGVLGGARTNATYCHNQWESIN